VLIQTFIAKSTVKALNKSVLHWLTLLDKPSFHTMLKSPLFERAAVKFRPLVRSYRRRITSKQRNVVQNTLDLNACNPECDVNCQIPLREVVHTGQALDPPAGDERVYYEIHRSSQVGCRRALSIITAGRQGQTCQPAGTTFGQTGRITLQRYGFPIRVCRQYFRPRANWSASLSSMASASSFLSQAFSSSSDFRRLTSGTSIPPYFLRQG